MRRRARGRSREAGASPLAAAAGAALLALALAAGCASGGRRSEPPEPALRIWAPGVVHWSGGRRELRLAIENGTNRTVRMEAPDARRVRISIHPDAGPDRACGVEPEAGDAGDALAVEPGDAVAVRVDLAAACGRLPPGEYRYVVGYEAPAAGEGQAVRLTPRHGTVVVEAAAPPADRGSLGSGGSR